MPSADSAKKTVFLGMSGGVDSSLSAVLLKEQGYNVVGAYMKNWSEDLPGAKCPWAEDLADAKRVAVKLGIDFLVFDFQQEYKNKVVDYMLAEFKKGNTPNPDIMCNQEIKFKLFYDIAREQGADLIATGHYARVAKNTGTEEAAGVAAAAKAAAKAKAGIETEAKTGVKTGATASTNAPQLLRALDENKDQTYFLYRISQDALSHTIFPVGAMQKTAVKRLAAEYGLDNAYKKESMGICFVGEVGIKDFLKQYIKVDPGEIRDLDTGKVLGLHEGAVFYTIGQRKGLNIGGGLPYYVVKKDIKNNIVYVSTNLNHTNLWTKKIVLKDLILRQNLPQNGQITARLRHRAPLIPAFVKLSNSEALPDALAPQQNLLNAPQNTPNVLSASRRNTSVYSQPQRATIEFPAEVKAPSPGQSIVFYDGEICLGGGIIA